MSGSPISDPLSAWHACVAARDPALLAPLIADDCVFTSPALHTPQVGKVITVKYLSAALTVLNGDDFRYTGEWRSADGRGAVLEFETAVDGLSVNGVDIIRWGDDGLITDFKVMIRPVKALMKVIEKMAAELTA